MRLFYVRVVWGLFISYNFALTCVSCFVGLFLTGVGQQVNTAGTKIHMKLCFKINDGRHLEYYASDDGACNFIIENDI